MFTLVPQTTLVAGEDGLTPQSEQQHTELRVRAAVTNRTQHKQISRVFKALDSQFTAGELFLANTVNLRVLVHQSKVFLLSGV